MTPPHHVVTPGHRDDTGHGPDQGGQVGRAEIRPQHPGVAGACHRRFQKAATATAFTADATDPASLRSAIDAARRRFGRIDVGYYGPAATMPLTDITGLDADGARAALAGVLPAVDFASVLLPELRERGDGGLLFAGGLSSVVPMPPLGGLALMSAALLDPDDLADRLWGLYRGRVEGEAVINALN
ncbi:MAG: hypothetical protein HYZ39_19675 [Mycolicibacterium cosmeticum]|nr:hypothetical protein [Mycolicibacterium cosmeticum]